jgi:hypothetical protein
MWCSGVGAAALPLPCPLLSHEVHQRSSCRLKIRLATTTERCHATSPYTNNGVQSRKRLGTGARQLAAAHPSKSPRASQFCSTQREVSMRPTTKVLLSHNALPQQRTVIISKRYHSCYIGAPYRILKLSLCQSLSH